MNTYYGWFIKQSIWAEVIVIIEACLSSLLEFTVSDKSYISC